MCDTTTRSRRARSIPRPRWALLYGLVSLAVAGLAVIEVAAPLGAVGTGLGCGLALGAFAAMALWVRRNGAALDLQEWCECASARVTVRVIPSRRPELPVSMPAEPPGPSRLGHGRGEEEEEEWAVSSARR